LPLQLHGVWDNWGIVFDPIPFQCTDGARKVRCWASLDALAKLAGKTSLDSLDDLELADLFARWVDYFAALASAKFDRGQIQADGSVCVGAQDVPDMSSTLKEVPPPHQAAAVRR
jgi:hypothetical protein